MKKVVVTDVGGYGCLKVEEHTYDPVLADDEVSIEVHACGLNFYDIYVRQGLHPAVKPPCGLGLECAGFIRQIGESVKLVQEGDRVAAVCFNGGAFADLIKVKESDVMKLPADVTFIQAAAITINYLTAYFSLFHYGNLRDNGAVLIYSAAGGVGCAATQLSKSSENVTVFGIASSGKHDFIKQNGVDFAIDYSEDPSIVVRQYRRQGLSVILESTAGPNLATSLNLLEPLGKVVIIGAKGMITGEHRNWWSITKNWWQTKFISPYDLIMKNCAVAGLNIQALQNESPETFNQVWKKTMSMCSKNEIDPKIDGVYRFDQIIEACKQIGDRKNRGKVILLSSYGSEKC